MILAHHLLVIIIFAGALITEMALGFAVLSLVTEVNAVFNQTRILHLMTVKGHRSMEHIKNVWIKIFTFVIRILII
jgi:hypothetical protein